jgi:tetratricopeptide (TPR) repeat protein
VSKKHHKHVPTSIADLKARVERTRREGRFQHALELVKQLFKAEPTPAHLELMKDTYLKRAGQLRSQGYTRDAATVLDAASHLDETNSAWLEQLASELAQCGDVARSVELLKRAPGGSISPAAMARLADAAFLADKGGRASLPPELQLDYDRIVTAFQQVESAQDEQAKATLQIISLRSPFLDWKLLLRGLQAYYQRDDDRARDNWQRLDPQRLPARLAAPFRSAIDPAYRDAQPPATRDALRRQYDWLQGSPVLPQMRSLRSALADQESLADAFRLAEAALPALKQQAPHLVPRLAHCMYWAILNTGPDELSRYKRVFGPPADDPFFNRLTALAYDNGGELTGAHDYWQRLEREISQHPNGWPGDQAKLARALIWLRMAENAASIPPPEKRAMLPRFLRELDQMPDQLVPGAEACFRRALELAPNLLDIHSAQFHYYLRNEQTAKAIKSGRRLLELFPDHVQTIEELAAVYEFKRQHDVELRLLEEALKHNPLDRDLSERVANAHLACAREEVEQGHFEPARAHYENAVHFADPARHGFIACCRAACELKAGEESRANELLAEARAKAPGEMLITYTLLVEGIRVRLPGTLKTRFTQEFNDAVADKPTPELARGLLDYLVHLQLTGVEYHGRKTHTKKIMDFIGRIDMKHCSEDDFFAIVGDLVRLHAPPRMTNRFLQYAQRHYRQNPFGYYYEAAFLMGDELEESGGPPPAQTMWLLTRAEELAEPRAHEPAVKAMLDDIANRRKMLMAFRGLLGSLMGAMGGFPFPDVFDDDYYDDDDFYDDGEF